MGLHHKRKGPARPSLEELPAKKALAGTLLEQEQELINTGKQKRKRRTRGFEASVDKALRDNFVNRGWDPSWLDMLSFDGKTIREYVTEAKRAQALGAITIGKYFYHDLRMKFQEIGNQEKEMVVDDPDEPEDPRIAEALGAMVANAVDLSLVSNLMEENYVPPNQKNAKALFSAFLEIPFSTAKGSWAAGQKVLAEVVKVVQALVSCRTPSWPAATNDFMAEVKLLVGNFCTYHTGGKSEGSGGSAGGRLVGKKAMQQLFKEAKEKVKTAQLSYEDLQPFRLFPWLLDAAEKNVTDEWLAKLVSHSQLHESTTCKTRGGSVKKQAKLQEQKAKAKKEKLNQLFT